MNRFLAHFICAFVPVKKYRKALRDYLYSFDFAKISYKVREFRSLENETQTVVLGSSHALYGYKPERTEFNFAEPSQDLYYSYKIYEKFCDFKKIKRVILFYSVFSAGHILEKTRWVKLCAIYKKVLGIPYRYNETELKKIEKNCMAGFISCREKHTAIWINIALNRIMQKNVLRDILKTTADRTIKRNMLKNAPRSPD